MKQLLRIKSVRLLAFLNWLMWVWVFAFAFMFCVISTFFCLGIHAYDTAEGFGICAIIMLGCINYLILHCNDQG